MTSRLTRLASIAGLLSSSIAVLSASAGAAGPLVFEDDFAGKLGPGWSFEREDPSAWRAGPAGLEVRVQPGNMWGGANNAKNVLVHPIPSPTLSPVEISVTLSNRPSAQWEQANLVWFYDGGNMVKLGQELVTGRLSIVMGREQNDQARTVAIIPLDDYRVELRLQATGNRVRGQFRTKPWAKWRDVGECDLPVKGEPKASLHFYNGPASEEHWVRVQPFQVRQLDPGAIDWPRERIVEKVLRSSDTPRRPSDTLPQRGGWSLHADDGGVLADTKAEMEQAIYQHRDGTVGWRWNRRVSGTKNPASIGLWAGLAATGPGGPSDEFKGVPVASLESLELRMDAVTRLENDQGDHNFAVVLPLDSGSRISIWFDWYGPASEINTLNDGHRDYGVAPDFKSSTHLVYRIRGFRGAPPRINLKAFLDDAPKRGLQVGEVGGVWLCNEVWDGSRGGTLVTQCDLLVNGARRASIP
jgi:hypothetical protein